MKTTIYVILSLFISLATGLSACSDESSSNGSGDSDTGGQNDAGDADAEHAEGPEEDACEHLVEGPFEPVTAVSPDDGAPPDVSAPHTAHLITLPPFFMGGYAGRVSYVADEDNEFFFGFDADVDIRISDVDGNEIDAEATEEGSEVCTELARSYLYDLAVGTYTLFILPTDPDTVTLVVVEGGGHAHEGE